MRYSHSRVNTYNKCPYQYKMRYVDKLKTISPTNADNALIIGQALHTGIEKGIDTAVKEYFMSFPIISDAQINESIKLEYLIAKTKESIPHGEFEVEIKDNDFHGFIDLLVDVGEGCYDIYDFKYTGNSKYYLDSEQLHLYKYFFEKNNPDKKIQELYFLFVPKVNIKQKKDEDLKQFRNRIEQALTTKQINLVSVPYDPDKVIDWLLEVKHIKEDMTFKRQPCYLCSYCDYELFCMKGLNYMNLPKNERRTMGKLIKKPCGFTEHLSVVKQHWRMLFPIL